VRRQPARFALAGLVGIAMSAYVVSRMGRAEDFFLPGLLANAGYALAYATSIAVRWPLLGVVIAIASNRGMEWRQDPARVRAYSRASWVRSACFAAARSPGAALPDGCHRRARRHAGGDGGAAVRRGDLAELAGPPHASTRLKPIRRKAVARRLGTALRAEGSGTQLATGAKKWLCARLWNNPEDAETLLISRHFLRAPYATRTLDLLRRRQYLRCPVRTPRNS
jgi:hypothetical protein